MEEIRLSGALTIWKAPHPAWKRDREWPEEVGFATWEAADFFVFIDPLVRDDLEVSAWERFDRAVAESGRPTAVLLTAPWHERSARGVAARYGARVWVHPRGRARVEDLPELEVLPNGVEVFVPAGIDEGQVAFHIVPEQALVVAEVFLGTDRGLRVLPSPGTRDWAAFAASLDRLRHLSIERVLVAHGPPVLERGEDAICAALDAFAARDVG